VATYYAKNPAVYHSVAKDPGPRTTCSKPWHNIQPINQPTRLTMLILNTSQLMAAILEYAEDVAFDAVNEVWLFLTGDSESPYAAMSELGVLRRIAECLDFSGYSYSFSDLQELMALLSLKKIVDDNLPRPSKFEINQVRRKVFEQDLINTTAEAKDASIGSTLQ
jgi:hypothetical protein